MIERGGTEFFEHLAIRRSNLLYNYIDNSSGFYRTFVNNQNLRSRMQVVFTIGSGEGKDHELVEKFLQEANDELGWLDIRSHPSGLPSDAIRVTMYNHQTEETVRVVREFMHNFHKRHSLADVSGPISEDASQEPASASSPKFGKASSSKSLEY